MQQLEAEAIILSRTNYGEADRILTLLTPEQGKLSVLAKGVRRVKSKLAGGIELFSISHITYIKGRGDLGTLVSTRLIKHYGTIVKDINRTMLGYDFIKILDRATEDAPEPEYFDLLNNVFIALDDPNVSTDLTKFWFQSQLLRLGGHTPNLQTDPSGAKLEAGKRYQFDYTEMLFHQHPEGPFTTDHLKLLRLAFNGHQPQVLAKVDGVDNLLPELFRLTQTTLSQYVRL